MKKSCLNRGGVLLLAVLLLAGCISPQNLEIFRGVEYNTRYEATLPEDLKLQPFDRLDIQVLSEIPQLAAPFNATINFQESATGSAAVRTVAYVVDREGCIEFPKLGPVHVVGLTTRELENLLAMEIRDRGYIKDPTVKVSLENFEITVIGDRNSQINVTGGINLIQLLARTGGPSTSFRMDDVMVLRTEDGHRMAYQVDLRKKEVFDSPVFYLQQNDIVYFKPKSPKPDPAIQGLFASLSPLFSTVSMTVSIMWLYRMIK